MTLTELMKRLQLETNFDLSKLRDHEVNFICPSGTCEYGYRDTRLTLNDVEIDEEKKIIVLSGAKLDIQRIS